MCGGSALTVPTESKAEKCQFSVAMTLREKAKQVTNQLLFNHDLCVNVYSPIRLYASSNQDICLHYSIRV